MGFEDVTISTPENELEFFQLITSNHSEFSNGTVDLSSFLSAVQNKEFSEKPGYVHEFLERCSISLVSTPETKRNAELETRIQKLKAEQDNLEYRKMTKNLGSSSIKNVSFKDEIKSVNSQITAVINFVFTVGGSFIFTYKAVEYALPAQNIPAQVLMGILAATTVAVADLYFLLRYSL